VIEQARRDVAEWAFLSVDEKRYSRWEAGEEVGEKDDRMERQ
jgi:hypothetical protein